MPHDPNGLDLAVFGAVIVLAVFAAYCFRRARRGRELRWEPVRARPETISAWLVGDTDVADGEPDWSGLPVVAPRPYDRCWPGTRVPKQHDHFVRHP